MNTIEIIAKCKFHLRRRKCICEVICFGSPFRFRRKWYIVILGRPNSNIVTSCVFEHCENKGQGVIVFLITNQLRTIALIYAAWLCQNTTIVFRKLMIRCESHHSIIIVGTYTPKPNWQTQYTARYCTNSHIHIHCNSCRLIWHKQQEWNDWF